MQPRLIIFDWDGTLADTTNPIIENLQRAFADCGLTVPEADTIRPLIGYSLPRMLQILASDAGEHQKEALAERYAALYLHPSNLQDKLLFADALPVLEALEKQGFLLAVATGKGRGGLDKAIGQSGTGRFWSATACAGEYPSKPAPDMILALCGELGIEPADGLMVGDTVFDMQMAASAGARGVAVATGAHGRSLLQAAPQIGILSRLAELPDFLRRL